MDQSAIANLPLGENPETFLPETTFFFLCIKGRILLSNNSYVKSFINGAIELHMDGELILESG